MELIGEYLKKIRIQKKLEIQDISNELKIGNNILKDIESDNIYDLKYSVYIIGHVRAYSKFLNLDDNYIIESFKNQIFYDSSSVQKIISKPIETSTFFSISKSISFASILIIGLSFYLLFIKPNDLQPKYAMIPDFPENLESEIEATQMNLILLEKENQKIKIVTLENETVFYLDQFIYLQEDEIKNNKVSSSVIASIPQNTDKEFLLDKITLKFLGPTWIQLRDNKDLIIISKLMNKGDEYSYNLSQNLNLTAGNAGNIIILINNLNKGRAGKRGEVIEALVIDNKFNN